jgi:hypothetical protein
VSPEEKKKEQEEFQQAEDCFIDHIAEIIFVQLCTESHKQLSEQRSSASPLE